MVHEYTLILFHCKCLFLPERLPPTMKISGTHDILPNMQRGAEFLSITVMNVLMALNGGEEFNWVIDMV